MPPVLLGNAFPLTLVRRSVRIEPRPLDELRREVAARGVVSFWGHDNTLPAARALLGFDPAPATGRPALTLNADLLPLLALNPRRVVRICSEDPKIKQAAEHTEKAARAAGCHAEFQIHQLRSQSPTTGEVRHAHKQLLSVFPDSVVNLSGGTKPMSLGAYLGASEVHGVPISLSRHPQPTIHPSG